MPYSTAKLLQRGGDRLEIENRPGRGSPYGETRPRPLEVQSMAEIERLDGLANRINEEHRRCEGAVGAALEHAMNAGDLLTEAKAGG